MKPIVTKLVIVLLLGVAALAQSPLSNSDSTAPECTDLSGKIPLPCPGQKNTAPARPAKAPAPAPAPGSDVQGVSVPAAQASQRDASTATGLHPVSTTTPPPVKVEPLHAEPQPSASSSTSAAVVLTQGCTDLSGRHAVPCPAKTYAAVSTAATRGPDAGSGAAPSGVASSAAIEPEPVSQPAGPSVHSPERALLRNLFADQKAIWGSPLRVRLNDVQWLVPLLGGTALVIGNDRGIENHVPTSATFRKRSNTLSNYGVAGFAGITGATWLWGLATHNDQMRETGVLSGEAALDSFALTYAIKSITQRDRPYQGNGHGNFWSTGDSFPSEHAAAAWSIATVFAHEYPGPLPKLLAYGGAAAISAARVTADKHFASDALVGSALGYFIGRQVYRAHHDQGLGDAAYGTFERARAAEGPRDPANMGSAYVALDSWVYGAMDRLAALGFINSAFAGLRPWTRMECARLLQEAERRLASDAGGAAGVEAASLYRTLQSEFFIESRRLSGDRNLSAELESVYTRFTGISGKPLNDGYHFGQTIINDYARPYEEGFNMVTGFSSHAEAGPLAFYVRGEYQHSPSAPALPDSARQTIAAVDFLPVPPATPVPTTDRFRLLDAYVGLNLHNWQVSAGKQSLSWGPGLGGSMMLSDNIEPINMIRFSRAEPIQLPSIFRLLGPIRSEFFLGQLSGYEFVQSPLGLVGQFGHSLDPQPFIHGLKFTFKPTPNLEVGFSRTTVYGGPGYPLTAHTLLHSMFSTGNTTAGAADKPGDRRSGMDFTYRLPGLRNWLTFYADGFTEDEYSPIAYADRSVWRAGLYLSHFPHISKLDLRTEGVYSDNPLGGNVGPGFFYENATWRDGYRNDGNLIGSWIGRAGQGAQAWATYHLNPKNSVQLNFRHQKVSREFIPSGGTLTDIGLKADLWVHDNMSLSSLFQYERWTFPVLATGLQSNVTTSLQFTYWPRGRGRLSASDGK